MENSSKLCIISKNHSHDTFDIGEYLEKLSHTFSEPDLSHTWIRSGIRIPSEYKNAVSSYKLVGECRYGAASVEILLIKTPIGISPEDTEKELESFILHCMKKSSADAAAIAAVPSMGAGWLSYIVKSPRFNSFSIPDDISEFICMTAIKNYLRTSCSITKTALDGYFSASYALYDDTIIRAKAKEIDAAIAEMKFCDIAAGSGEIVKAMCKAAAGTRLSLNKYIGAAHERTKEKFEEHFIKKSLWATDSDSGAIDTMRMELAFMFAGCETGKDHLKFGSILTEDLFAGTDGFDIIVTSPPHMRQELFSSAGAGLKEYKSNKTCSDLCCYYAERAISLLKDSGSISLLMSNRWMRAAYGAPLRELFSSVQITDIADYGSLTPIKEFSTPILLISALKTQDQSDISITNVEEIPEDGIGIYAEENARLLPCASLGSERWDFNPDSILHVMREIEYNSQTLRDYTSGEIYRGILTGLNEAFIIDSDTAEAFKTLSPQSSDVIRPFLSGRDVKRFEEPTAKKQLIFMPKGFTNKNRGEAAAIEWFAAQYRLIASHLARFENKASARSDKGDYWWELRSCRYYEAFEQTKIICPSIVKRLSAAMDTKRLYSNDKTMIIPGEDYFLLGLLNSKLMDFYFRKTATELLNEHFELKPGNLAALPIRKTDRNDRKYEELRIEISAAAKNLSRLYSDYPAKTSGLMSDEKIETERKLNNSVYRLYRLSPKDIDIIENY